MEKTTDVEEIKLQLQTLFEEMPTYYKMLFKEDKIIKETKSTEYNVIFQNGFTFFESRDITHFIAPTNILNRKVEPNEYEHKVLVYNTRTNLFDTVFTGLSHKCVEHVFKFQEAKYGFSLKNRTVALGWLGKTKEYFDWTGELMTDEYNKQSEERIKAIIHQAKMDCGIVNEDQLPQVDPELVKQTSLHRSQVRAQRRKEYEEDNAKLNDKGSGHSQKF